MKRLFFPLFAGLLWLMSGTLSATERTYNVLFIQSYTKILAQPSDRKFGERTGQGELKPISLLNI